MNITPLYKQGKADSKFNVVILIKESSVDKEAIQLYYGNPLVKQGINKKHIAVIGLKYTDAKKVLVSTITKELPNILSALEIIDCKVAVIADVPYFKKLTKQTNTVKALGKTYKIEGTNIDSTIAINYGSIFYNPLLEKNLDQSLEVVRKLLSGKPILDKPNILHNAHYPDSVKSIKKQLNKLLKYKKLTVDIEAFSLLFYKAGIGSIAFAWNKHSGVAFCVDIYMKPKETIAIRELLINWFMEYKGICIYHNINYDAKVLIYELFMQHDRDVVGLVDALPLLTHRIEDTRLIAYTALNSTAKLPLGLKALSQEFAGDYAEDVTDIRQILKKHLLEYNLSDCCATWYVYDKYLPICVKDKQEHIYREVLLKGVPTLVHTELTGFCLDKREVKDLTKLLKKKRKKAKKDIASLPIVKQFTKDMRIEAMKKKNKSLKLRRKPLSAFKDIQFKPTSGVQVRKLLYNVLDMPVLQVTKTGKPSTGKKVIIFLLAQFKNK